MPSPDFERGSIIHEGLLFRGYRYTLPIDLARSYANEARFNIKNHPVRAAPFRPRIEPGRNEPYRGPPRTPSLSTRRSSFNFLPLDGL